MLPMIIDTDIGPDCDDAGALAVAAYFGQQKKLGLLCVTCCNSLIYAPQTVRSILDCFGMSRVPVGYLKQSALFEDFLVYNRTVAENYCKNPDEAFEDATSLLRKTLYHSAEKVTIVTIGTFTNIANLLKSQADEEIPLSGIELVLQKVEKLVSMAGTFSLGFPEFNIEQDVPAAAYVVEHFPAPVLFQGFEVGKEVFTGGVLIPMEIDSPVRMAYQLYLEHLKAESRESWDLTTLYYAIEGDGAYFNTVQGGRILLDEQGVTSFDTQLDRAHGYIMLQEGKAQQLSDTLDEILLAVHRPLKD